MSSSNFFPTDLSSRMTVLSSLNCRLVKKLSQAFYSQPLFSVSIRCITALQRLAYRLQNAHFSVNCSALFSYNLDERYAFNFALSGMIHLSKMPGLYRIQLENTCLVMGAISRISPVNATLFGHFVAPYPRYFPTHSVPFHCYTLSTVM